MGGENAVNTATAQKPEGYRILNAEDLRHLIAHLPLARQLGGRPETWRIEEVGDGNLNLVFLVRGKGSGGFAVKQALPYVRLVGESWPLPLSRAHYEHSALTRQAKHVPKLVPKIHHYDEALALIVMELLEPHIIMRHGMMAGTLYPKFAEDISSFMAATLFHTSTLAMTAENFKSLMAHFAGNTALCNITEDLIFTEPYMVAENNRWTRPWLDGHAAKIRQDNDLKIAISRLKLKFMGSPQAMIHGDLHTGSVMLTSDDTRIIDPEFAFVGPMGFDVGAVIANLLLNYFSQIGHENKPGIRDDYRQWIVDTIEKVWTLFHRKFLDEWRTHGHGDGYPYKLFDNRHGTLALERERESYMGRLFRDTLGFAAAKMIRRIVGLAHNIDLEYIENPKIRATAEARSLMLARDLMVNTSDYRDITVVTAAARRINDTTPELTERNQRDED